MWHTAQPEKFNFFFQEVSASINKTFILARRQGTRLSFYKVKTASWYFLVSQDPKFYVVRQLVRQLVYTMFISNNRTSFHLWWKENLVKHGKVSKNYETDWRLSNKTKSNEKACSVLTLLELGTNFFLRRESS